MHFKLKIVSSENKHRGLTSGHAVVCVVCTDYEMSKECVWLSRTQGARENLLCMHIKTVIKKYPSYPVRLPEVIMMNLRFQKLRLCPKTCPVLARSWVYVDVDFDIRL